jgi:hypothetical protein
LNRNEKKGVCKERGGEGKCVQRGKLAKGYEGKRRKKGTEKGKAEIFFKRKIG